MKSFKEILDEARMIATGDYKISSSGRKVRRLIKIGDDDYNRADDIDKDGDVDADDMKRKKMTRESAEQVDEKRGLWDNIHAKQERIKNGSGEHMRKPGSKGAPTAADFKASQNEEVELDEKINVVSGNAPRNQGRYASNDQTRVDKTSSGNRIANGTVYTGNKKPANTSVHDKAKARLAKMNEETAGETYEDAAEHLIKAKLAKENSKEYHFHMSNHHEAMGHWHTSKGRHHAADKEFNKAEGHHELGYNVKEEVEQIDEISDKTLGNYIDAARKDREKNKINKAAPDTAQRVHANERDKKRIAGMNKAKAYLTPGTAGHAKNQARRAMHEDAEQIEEAVSVKKQDYSWGKMVTVHHGADTSYPLHPEHQEKIKNLKDGEKTSFKDETNSTVHAHREGESVHLTRPKTSSTKTTVAHSHFNESAELVPFDKPYRKVESDVVIDKSGAKHGPMSRARNLARMAALQQQKKAKK